MLADAGLQCSTSIDRDWLTIQSRVKHEGLSFLTITLPSFAKGLLKALERGAACPSDFEGFHSPRGRCLPAFLQGFTARVFDEKGVVLDAPDTDSLDAARSFCVAFGKIKIECTLARRRKAEQAFIDCEREVSRFRVLDWASHENFYRVSSILYSTVLSHLSSKLWMGELVPRHGPGATQERTLGNRKFLSLKWTSRLERAFPASEYLISSLNELIESSDVGSDGYGQYVEFVKEPPVRVVFVPKTLKTPRVIAIEPTWQQYAQQALMRELVSALEDPKVSPVSGHVNFTRQDINGSIALESSRNRELATLDLSEASDRVNAALVEAILRPYPDLRRAVFACRSKRAKLPSGVEIPLKKFASMGSALTFPLEAMVFNSIVVTSILEHRRLPITPRNVALVQKTVYVYGDDIVCRSNEVEAVVGGLEAAGLKVNRAKTFARSNFRESCGTDAFDGYRVTPVYLRHLPPKSARATSELISWTTTANLFYKKGWWKTAQWMRDFIESMCGVVPHVAENSGVEGWFSFTGRKDVHRWNSDLQRYEVKGFYARALKTEDPLDGYRALLKFFLNRGVEPLAKDSFTHRVQYGKLKTTYRWAPAA